MLNSIAYCRTNKTKKSKLQIYNTIVNNTVTYGAKTWKFKKNLEWKLMQMEIDFSVDLQDGRDYKKLQILLLSY